MFNKFSAGALTLAAALVIPTFAFASHGVTVVNLSQKDPANGNANVPVGGIVTGTQIGLQGSSGSSTWGSGYDYRLQFEVVPAGQAFTGTVSVSGAWQANFKPGSSTRAYPQVNYAPGNSASSWRWRVREQTSTNMGGSISSTGPWTDFGNNGTSADCVTNQPPTAEANGPYSGTQGVAVALDATGSSDSDGSIVSYEWDCTSDGTYDVTSTSVTGDTCTYADDGTYTVTLRVTDDDGSTATDTATVDVPNVLPTAEANGPYTGTKGFAVSIDAIGSADSDGTISTYEWDCDNDGVFELSSSSPTGESCTFAAVGTYTITLQVTDDDGGQATDTADAAIGNDPPTADAGGPYTGNEGSPIVLDGSASSDVGGGSVVQWEWDCTDDGTYDVTASAGTGNACTYTDDGTFTVRLRVTDDDGATAEATATATIANVAPAITSATGPATGDEGSSLSFSGAATDVGADDVAGLTWGWDWGDGNTGTGANPSYAWMDEGTYTITVTVADDDGGSDTTTLSVDIANVAPIIDSTPTTTADEGVEWTYAPTAIEPGNDTLTWSMSASAPASMTIDPATGALAWTPDYAAASAGTASLVLTVDDGDGGSDAQSITIVITVADADGDGMPDGWELANGLDPTDPNDAGLDPDGDGMTNLDELDEGTDPNSYDGPDAPVLIEPIGGDEVDSTSPDLLWTNATDPQGEALLYTVEVYEDAALTVLATSVTALAEDASGTSTWKVDIQLAENAEYWWRAQAEDAWVAGPWSTEESFVVNAVNEEPGVPTLTAPIGGETAASLTPTLSWSEATDVDGDVLSYDVEVYDIDGVLVASTTEVAGDGVSAQWTLDVDLLEDATYSWTARAVDEHGLEGAWATEESFFVDTDNAPPADVTWLAPTDGGTYETVDVFTVTESTDPEGADLEYWFEVDTVASFDSADFAEATVPGTGTGAVDLGLSAAGITLPENGTIYARVRAVDPGGVTSNPATISFFVRGTNDAPPMPVLISPEDGADITALDFEVEVFADPEGDVVFVDYVIARDAELTDVVLSDEGLLAPVGILAFSLSDYLEGTYYWSARVVDVDGAASEWAGAWSFTLPVTEVPGDDDDSAGEDPGTGCDCQSSMAGPSSSAAALLLLLLPLAVRRRR